MALTLGLGTALAAQAPPAAPEPGPRNEVVPAFRAPFAGDYPVANVFDHDLPFWNRDTNGYQLTFWGEPIAGGIDGHDGYDWRLPEGTPILAVADGEVVFAGATRAAPCPLLGRETTGLVVTIEHRVPASAGELRLRSGYVHLSQVDVAAGQRVAQGQQLGLSGNTGCSTRPHLHLTVWRIAQAAGRFVRIDPYGWDGMAPDPWAVLPEGAASLWLWEAGHAPLLYRLETREPNPGPGDTAPVALTAVRWLGYRDEINPNNEYVELTLDPRYAPGDGVSLDGFTLQNNAGDTYAFPAGVRLLADRPRRVYSGPGSDTPSELYWGRSSGAWDNRGDCVHLARPDGLNVYRLRYAGAAC